LKEGILLFAHGSRDPEWARPFERISQELARKLPQAVVCTAYHRGNRRSDRRRKLFLSYRSAIQDVRCNRRWWE
jgi:sirohydrochlorin ferrochelatase